MEKRNIEEQLKKLLFLDEKTIIDEIGMLDQKKVIEAFNLNKELKNAYQEKMNIFFKEYQKEYDFFKKDPYFLKVFALISLLTDSQCSSIYLRMFHREPKNAYLISLNRDIFSHLGNYKEELIEYICIKILNMNNCQKLHWFEKEMNYFQWFENNIERHIAPEKYYFTLYMNLVSIVQLSLSINSFFHLESLDINLELEDTLENNINLLLSQSYTLEKVDKSYLKSLEVDKIVKLFKNRLYIEQWNDSLKELFKKHISKNPMILNVKFKEDIKNFEPHSRFLSALDLKNKLNNQLSENPINSIKNKI